MRVAAYARFSTEMQREASLEDQLRVCGEFAVRHGWPQPINFTDSAVSGSRRDRIGYRRMLAQAHDFDVLLLDDLTRFSRDNVELQSELRRLKFAGVRVIAIADGLDTARDDAKLNAGLRGLMGELYLDDLAKKTHRGLTGRALQGASAGGLPYGYRVTGVGSRAIDEAQAAVVRRVYAEYLSGRTPRQIASALNAEGVPSARGSSWSMSAIHGDQRRGIGILANPIYVGRQIWNRSTWVKHPDTRRRIRKERDESEWVIKDKPELAIVDAATWDAVQRRLRGKKLGGAHKGGRAPRHLLSGILRCGVCGGPMVIIDRYRYGCSIAKDRGAAACTSTVRFPRLGAEAEILAGIKRELLSEEAFQACARRAAAALKKAAPDLDGAKRRLATAQRERENLMVAIRAGILTRSTKAELQAAERAEEAAEAELARMRGFQPAQLVPRLRERWRRIAASLEVSGRNIPGARDAIRELVGDEIVVDEKAGDLFARIAGSSCQIDVVAGAGSGLYLSEPIWIPIPRRQAADDTHRDAAAQ